MIKNKTDNKKGLVALTATAVAAITVLVVTIAAIGAAPFSYQQASEQTGPRITSDNIVDGEVRNQDLATDAA